MPLGCVLSDHSVTIVATLKANLWDVGVMLAQLRDYTNALSWMLAAIEAGTVRVFRQYFALENAIGSHTCSHAARMRAINAIFSGVRSSYRLVLQFPPKH
jgi:hypothetical protein